MGSGYEKWDEIYGKYTPEELPWETGRPRENLVRFVEEGKIPPGSALDICCGAGTQSVYLAKKGFEVSCLDISEKAIQHARRNASKGGVDIDFHIRNFLDLPFEENTFDLVLDSGCFHHVEVEDRETYLKGLNRVLSPGGKYFLMCFSYRNGPAWNHFTEEEIRDIFSGALAILEVVHVESVEGDGIKRYFYNVLMEKEIKSGVERDNSGVISGGRGRP